MTIVSAATFYRWVRAAKNGKPKPKNPKGGQRKPKELRDEVFVTESTEHSDSAWKCQQLQWFAKQTKDREKKPELILHDRDLKFTKEFTQSVKNAGMKTSPLPMGSPNLNGRCERFIETIKLECLARFLIFGKRHLGYLLTEFTDYYNTRRSHMECGHLPPLRDEPETVEFVPISEVAVTRYVGGLITSFGRKAA